jgi:hypothetical protein
VFGHLIDPGCFFFLSNYYYFLLLYNSAILIPKINFFKKKYIFFFLKKKNNFRPYFTVSDTLLGIGKSAMKSKSLSLDHGFVHLLLWHIMTRIISLFNHCRYDHLPSPCRGVHDDGWFEN